ncbi:HXXEE domain-containing protein [Streptomyces sp. NPDC048425]|uniref:HXXEE domain-containing protein n=1 Tax=Streptomyces sp. NPDC048425 TaxID=3365548 RepID=UPI003716EA2E
MSCLDQYRKQWPRVGGVVGMALGGAVALASRRMSKPQTLSALNWGALLVHQYEEYEDPGYFPGQFNKGLFKSAEPDRYPLNTNSALCVNVPFAYPFYILPIVFPRTKWLGIAPAIFGMGQAVGHGIVFPKIAGAKYSPGFLASFFLHIPLGLRYLQSIGPISRSDWIKGAAYTVFFAAVGIGGPNLTMKDHDSPYRFTKAQVGPYNETA